MEKKTHQQEEKRKINRRGLQMYGPRELPLWESIDSRSLGHTNITFLWCGNGKKYRNIDTSKTRMDRDVTGQETPETESWNFPDASGAFLFVLSTINTNLGVFLRILNFLFLYTISSQCAITFNNYSPFVGYFS